MLKKALATTIVLCGLSVVCINIFAESPKLAKPNKTERLLIPAQSGSWQMFWIPKKWIAKNLPSKQINRIYLAVRPPHQADINEYWPCYAPSRLMVGIYYSKGNPKEMLHSCFDYCGPNDKPGNMHKGLWGPDTKLAKVEVSLTDDKIVLKEIYINRRQESDLIKKGQSTEQVDHRTWQRTLDSRQLMTSHETSSCLDL